MVKKKERNTFLNGSVWWKYLLSVLALAVYLLPIYVIVVMAMKPVTDLSSRLVPPKTINWDNFVKAWVRRDMVTAVKNSAIITLGVVFVEVFLGCMAAYPIARNRSKFNMFIKSLVLGIMMIPGLSIVVGVYTEIVAFHAISTYWGIIIVTAAFGLPLSIYLYSNFVSAIPISLDEAAAIDGAGAGMTFLTIILPQLKPVTVTVIIMKGIGAWNEYAYSLYILQKPAMYNVSITIKQFFSESGNDLNSAAAAILIAIVPVIIVYLALQRYFIQGQLDSAVKG